MPARHSSSSEPVQETQYIAQPDDSLNLWEADCILDERGPAITGAYLIKWKGIDPATGTTYEPTWEKKGGCTPALISDWKKLKKEDPTVVGRAAKEMEEKRSKATKRKRISAGGTKVKKAKVPRKSAATGTPKPETARTHSRSRSRSTMTPPSLLAKVPPGPRSIRLNLSTPVPNNPKTTPTSLPEVIDPPAPRNPPLPHSKSPSVTSNGRIRTVEVEIPTAVRVQSNGTRARRSNEVAVLGDDESAAIADVLESIHERGLADAREKGAGVSEIPPIEDAELVVTGPARTETEARPQVKEIVPEAAVQQDDHASDISIDLTAVDGQRTVGPADKSEAQESLLAKREEIVQTTPIRKKINTINLSTDTPAQAGPGPTTTKNQQNGVSNSSRIGPVRQMSPSVFHPFLPTPEGAFHTQMQGSIPISQQDPIDDFSSPARPHHIGKPVHIEKEDAVVVTMQEAAEIDEAKDEFQESVPAKVVKRIIDGEEVYVAWTESMDEEDAMVERETGQGPLQLDVDEQNDWEDEDLALLESPIATTVQIAPNVVEGSSSGLTVFPCQWGDCGEILDSAPSLSRHLLSHTDTVDPPVHVDSSSLLGPATSEQELQALIISLQERDSLIDDLSTRLSRADMSLENLSADREFFRIEYIKARDRVNAQEQRAKELDEQIATLREQLTLGLKQRDLHFDAIKAQRSAENAQYRMQNKLLLDQSRLTDDTIRRKASQFGPLKKENDLLKEGVWEQKQKVLKLQRRNDELLAQVEVLRAREMGVFGDEDDDTSGTDDGGSSTLGRGNPGELDYDIRPANMTSSRKILSLSQTLPDDVQMMETHDLGEEAVDEMSSSQGDIVKGAIGARCKWREDELQCAVLLNSLQDIVQHSSDHAAGRVDARGKALMG